MEISRRQSTGAIYLGLWALALLLMAFTAFNLERFFTPVLWAGLWHGTVALFGTRVLSWVGWGSPDCWQDRVWGWAFGLGLAGLAAFGLFALGLASPTALALLWALFFAVGLLGFYREGPMKAKAPMPRHWRPLLLVGAVLLGAAAVPPLFYDTAVYHFGVVAQMGLWGETVDLPHSSFASMPMLTELAVAMPYWLSGNATVFNASNALGFLLCGLTVSSVAHRHFPAVDNWGLVLAVASCPLLVFVSGAGKPDWFTAVCFAGVLQCWLEQLDSPEPKSKTGYAPAVVMGCFAGFTVGTKYHGLLYLGLLLVATLFVGSWRRSLIKKDAIGFWVALALTGLPFLVRNWVSFGNPVYPFAHEWLGGGHWNERTASLYGGIAEKIDHVAALLNLPMKLSFSVTDGTMNDLMGPVWLFLLPASLLARPWPRKLKVVLAVVVLMAPFWALSNAKVRYFAPLWLLLFWVSGWGWSYIQAQAARVRTVGVIGVVLLVVSSWLWNLQADEALLVKRGRYLLGHQDEQSYLRASYGPYEAYSFANSHLPEDAQVWLVGDARIAYLKRRAVFSDVFVTPLQDHLLRTQPDAESLTARLLAEGTTHLILSEKGMVQQALQWQTGGWTPAEQEIWRHFLNEHAQVLYRANGWSVFKIRLGKDRSTHDSDG